MVTSFEGDFFALQTYCMYTQKKIYDAVKEREKPTARQKFFPHLTVFDKIGVDWTPCITSCPPLQVIHIRLMSLGRADDDRRLWNRTVSTPVSRQVDCVAFIFGQETLMALVALHWVERWRRLQ